MLSLQQVSDFLRTTFEEMAFLDISDGPSPKPAATAETVVSMEFSRPNAGMLVLVVHDEVVTKAAEAIYGEDASSISEAQRDDSLLEILNVLAGRLLSERFGPGTSYTMGLPNVQAERPTRPEGSHEYRFHTDAWELTLWWVEP